MKTGFLCKVTGTTYSITETNGMRKHYLWFLSLAIAAVILLGGHAALKAQQATSTAAKGGRWSDPATWTGKKVPADGALVTIG